MLNTNYKQQFPNRGDVSIKQRNSKAFVSYGTDLEMSELF